MFEGQFAGVFTEGTNTGIGLLDLEARGVGYSGSAFLFEHDKSVPAVLARIDLPSTDIDQEIEAPIVPLWPVHGGVISPAEFERAYPGVQMAATARVRLQRVDHGVVAEWSTSLGTNGKGLLHPGRADEKSELLPTPDIASWSEFKAYVLANEPRRFIYRGQPTPSRLRTSFHRTWRKDLVRYLESDIPSLRQALSGQVRHVFRQDDPSDNGAFWTLLQHHGYPTPLLDWSYSPFVAAYFAFRSFRRTPDVGDKVRIYIFDRRNWTRQFNQHVNVTYSPPHLSIIETLAIENPRALPQQGLSTVTNIDDIETFIGNNEAVKDQTFLTCVDLPFDERHDVLRELSLMGITAASLFPGLDGACEEAKARHFGYNV